LTGEDGASHQALEDIAIMRAIPNMKVVQPADHFETLSVMEALMKDFGPTYVRLLRQGTPVIYGEGVEKGGVGKDDGKLVGVGSGVGGNGKVVGVGNGVGVGGRAAADFKFGKSDIVYGGEYKKADVCIFASGALVASSIFAAQKIEEGGSRRNGEAGAQGGGVTTAVRGVGKNKIIVVNVSSIKPIDTETIIECAGRAKICMTAEDHNIIGGLAGAVAEVFAENGVGKKLIRIGMNDRFGESGKSGDLYKKYGLDGEGVRGRVEKELK